MTLTFDQKPEDLYVLSLYVGWDSPERRQFRRVSNTLPILVLIGMAAWMFGNDLSSPVPLTAVLGLGIASVFLMPRLVRWMQVRRIDSMIKRHPNPELLIGPRQLELTDSQIQMEVNGRVMNFPWEKMRRWVELSEHFLVFVKANVALVVPKTAFLMTSHELEFKEILERNIGAAAHQQNNPSP